MNDLAIVTLTPGGEELGRRLVQALGEGTVLLARGVSEGDRSDNPAVHVRRRLPHPGRLSLKMLL